MILTEYDEQEAMNSFKEEGRIEGREEGRIEGRDKERNRWKIIMNRIKAGDLSIEDAFKCFDMPDSELVAIMSKEQHSLISL